MPPLPRLASRDLEDLVIVLRRGEPGIVLRCVARAEALAADIDPAGTYPLEWVEYRLTDARAGQVRPGSIGGAGVLEDLSAIAEHLSDAAGQTLTDARAHGAADAEALARRWGVSRKSIDRFRKRGLVARRARDEGGKPHLVFYPTAISSYEARGVGPALGGARARMTNAERDRILRRAAVYRRRLRWTLNQAAQRLADRLGRSHEGVRQVLLRHDAASASPIFGPRRPSVDRRRRSAARAMARGIEPGVIAQRHGRTRASVVRLAVDARAAALRALALEPLSVGPLAEIRGNWARHDREYLGHAAARAELGRPVPTTLADVLALAAHPEIPMGAVEIAQARAYHYLMHDVRARIGVLPGHGAPLGAVDEIETRLRWMARLKAELVRAQLSLLVRTLSTHAPEGLDRLRAAELRDLILRGIEAASSVVDGFDPFRGGRLAAPAGLAFNRVGSRWSRERTQSTRAGRASPRITEADDLGDWSRGLCPWQSFLEPDARVRRHLDRLPEADRSWLVDRFGWGGSPPVTLAKASEARGLAPMHGARVERRAIRLALAAARMGA